MRLIIISISFIAVFTFQLFSQVEIPVFEKFSGKWQGVVESEGVKFQETIEMKWIFNHNFFQIDIWRDVTSGNTKKYEATEKEVFTIDNEGKLSGWSAGSKGFSYMLSFTGTFNENTVTLTGSNANAKSKIVYELMEKQLVRKYEYEPATGENEQSEVVYSSVRSDYSTHILPVKYDNINGPGLAYVCHLTEDFVTVFDPKTNELIGKIPGGRGSSWICFSSDGYNGYITNYNSGNLTVFNRKTNETIATVGAGENPTFLVEANHKILISHQSEDGIWVLDTYSNSITKRLIEGTGPLYLIKNENKIYQPQIFIPYLYIIDPLKLEVKKKVKTGGRPMEMAFIDNQKFGYMVNFDFHEVTKYDTKTDNAVKHIKDIKNPRGIASSPDGKLIYVTNVVDGKVYVINTNTDSLTAVIDGFTMPVSVAFTADGKYAYVLNQSAATISIIDTKENNIIQTFYVAWNPISIVIDER